MSMAVSITRMKTFRIIFSYAIADVWYRKESPDLIYRLGIQTVKLLGTYSLTVFSLITWSCWASHKFIN